MKKAVSLACLLSVLFLFSGCYSYNETEALSIISCASADKTEGGFKLSVMTLDFNTPSAEDVGKPKVTSGTGATLAEAGMQVEKILGSKLYWSHCYAFFIGSDAAASGIQPILDFLLLTNNARININIIIAKGCEGSVFLNATDKEGSLKNQGVIFHQVLVKNIKNHSSPAFKAYQTVNAIADGTGSFILPAIEKTEEQIGFVISNSAVFFGQKLKGFCDKKYSDLISILKNENESYVFFVDDPGVGKVSVELRKLKTKIAPHYQNGSVNFTVTVSGDAVIKEQDGGKINSTVRLKNLSTAVDSALEKNITDLINNFSDSYGTEALSFGAAAYVKSPKGWKALNYKNNPLEAASYQVKAKISAKNYGTLTA